MANKKKMIAFYLRCASTKQGEEGKSMELQKKELLLQVKNRYGNHPIRIYSDEGKSGLTLNRPGLSRLRKDVKRGSIGTILVTNFSRLSRSFTHQVFLSTEFAEKKVKVKSISAHNAEEMLLQGLQGLFSEFQKIKFSERVREGIRLQKLLPRKNTAQ